jgi:methylenetetrahydrofolate reductase (NADPH)
MAHLTCVGATRDEIQGVLDELAAAGLENVLALRGDPPQGAAEFVPTPGGFRHASELAEFIRGRYGFCVGGACYPEKHPEAPSMEADLGNLQRKVDAGAAFLITQLFFDNADFFRFRERAAALGIRVPIIAGIMPILGTAQIKRFTQMCGARIPAALLGRIEAAQDRLEDVRAIGVEHAARQCEDLLANGVAGIHFYTLNRSPATRAIFAQIKGLVPEPTEAGTR